MQRRKVMLAAALLVGAGLFINGTVHAQAPGSSQGAWKSTSNAMAGQTLKVANILFFTGQFAAYSTAEIRGRDLAVEDIVKGGGINGAKIEFVESDAASDYPQSVALVRKAAADPSISLIMGPPGTGALLPASQLLPQLKIAIVNPSSAGAWPVTFNEWTFRNQAIVNVYIPLFMAGLKDKLNVKTLGIIYDQAQEVYVGESKLIRESAANLGIKVISDDAIRLGDTDFSAQMIKLLAQKPDVLYVSTPYNEGALIMRQARQRGFTGLFAGPDSDPTALIQKSDGAAAGMVTALTYNAADPRQWVQDVFERYRKKYNAEPAARMINAYDAVMLIANAAARANTTTDRQAIRDALGSTKGFEGIATKYTYEGSGDNKTQSVYFYQLTADGKYQPLK